MIGVRTGGAPVRVAGMSTGTRDQRSPAPAPGDPGTRPGRCPALPFIVALPSRDTAPEAGHRFNVAVVYVPPAGVSDAVIEAVRVNPLLTRVVILTEKVPLSDARIIRPWCSRSR